MKFNPIRLAISISALFALMFTGCATPIVTPGTPGTPGTPAITNATTGAISPALPPVAAIAAVTNYAPNVTATTLIAEGNSAVPFIPAPYNGAATALLGIATLITGWIAARKNGQLNTANQVTTAIIQGVESAGTAAAAVKQAVATVSKANGVSDAVEAAVNKVTGAQ